MPEKVKKIDIDVLFFKFITTPVTCKSVFLLSEFHLYSFKK